MRINMAVTPVWQQETPLLSIAYLTAYLRHHGHEVKAFDFNIEVKKSGFRNMLPVPEFEKKFMAFLYPEYFSQENLDAGEQKAFRSAMEYANLWSGRLLDNSPDAICFSTYYTTLLLSLMVARRIREKDKDRLIIFGGPEGAAFRNARFLISTGYVDAVVMGEGEGTLLNIIESITESGLSRTEGSLTRKNGLVYDGGPVKLIEDVNSIPYPDFTDTPSTKYLLKNTLPAITSRGCIGSCIFCEERAFWGKFRARNPENIVGEFSRNVKQLGIRRFRLNDSLINGDLKNLPLTCDRIMEAGLDVVWGGNARINPSMDEQLLAKMHNAGCRFLVYGVESGSDKVLGDMRKGTSTQQTENLIKQTRSMGIRAYIFLITGFPTEDEEDFMETMEFLKRNKRYIEGVATYNFMIHQGASIYKILPQTNIRLVKLGVDYPPQLDHCRTYFTFYNTSMWYTKDGKSTPEIRQRRHEVLEDFLRDEGMSAIRIPIEKM